MFADFRDVNTLTTADLKLPIIVELGYDAQNQALLTVIAAPAHHNTHPFSHQLHQNQSISLIPSRGKSIWMSHLLNIIKGKMDTQYSYKYMPVFPAHQYNHG